MQHKNADPILPSFFLGGTWMMQSEDLLSKAKLKFISYLVKVGIEPNYSDCHVAKTIANNICCDCHWWWRIWRRLSYQSLARKESESCPWECMAVKNWCLGKTCVFQGHTGCGGGRSKLGWNSFSSQVSHLLKMKWSVLKKYREPKILDKKHFHFQSKRWAQTQGRRSSQRLAPSATLWRLVASTNKVKTFLKFTPRLQQATRWIPPWLVVQPDNLCTYWLTFC